MQGSFIETLDFGRVPVRKNFTEGQHYADIELAEREGDPAVFAEIRTDLRTNQPFAVLFDCNWNQI